MKKLEFKNFYSGFQVLLFWLFNWIFLPNREELKTLRELKKRNKKKATLWFLYSVITPIFPFVVFLFLELLLDEKKILLSINNGSLPIIAFTVIASNYYYLIERYPENSKIYPNVKLKIQIISIYLLFLASILFVFQSLFLIKFNLIHLYVSSILSLVIIIFSISAGKKMFLLQYQILKDYEKDIEENRKKLVKDTNKEDDIDFS